MVSMKKGFTLAETMVALGVFVIAVGGIVGIFVIASSAHRKSAIGERVRHDARTVLEAIETDMRIGIPDYAAYGGSAPTTGTDTLRLRDEDANAIVYQLQTVSANCVGASAPCLTRQISGGPAVPITSFGVTVQNAAFYIFPATNPYPGGTNQPKVAIVLTLQSTEDAPNQVTLNLQTAASSRYYGP